MSYFTTVLLFMSYQRIFKILHCIFELFPYTFFPIYNICNIRFFFFGTFLCLKNINSYLVIKKAIKWHYTNMHVNIYIYMYTQMGITEFRHSINVRINIAI